VAATRPFRQRAGDVNVLRERLLDLMWDDVGIIRSAESLARALNQLDAIDAELDAAGIADIDRAFNLTWHDWLNLKNLVAMSKVVATAALQRQNSRGAHFRSDFPDAGDLPTSTFTIVRERDGQLHVADEPVQFTIVKPGESLLKSKDAAE
jgi:fumarate reductase flavoprotein subunit